MARGGLGGLSRYSGKPGYSIDLCSDRPHVCALQGLQDRQTPADFSFVGQTGGIQIALSSKIQVEFRCGRSMSSSQLRQLSTLAAGMAPPLPWCRKARLPINPG